MEGGKTKTVQEVGSYRGKRGGMRHITQGDKRKRDEGNQQRRERTDEGQTEEGSRNQESGEREKERGR